MPGPELLAEDDEWQYGQDRPGFPDRTLERTRA